MFLLISIVPAFMKKYYEKREGLTKGYLVESVLVSIFIGLEVGLFNVLDRIEIMRQTRKTDNCFRAINSWLYNNGYVTITVVVALCVIFVLGITLIDKLNSIEWNWHKNVIYVILCISLTVSALILLFGTTFRLSISIEDKTKYEFVTYDDEYVILSSYNEKLLPVFIW